MVQKVFGPQKSSGSKLIIGQKTFWHQRKISPKNVGLKKIIGEKKIWGCKQFFCPKNVGSEKNLVKKDGGSEKQILFLKEILG